MPDTKDFFYPVELPIDHWTDGAVQWLSMHWRPAFQTLRPPLTAAIDWLTDQLTGAHPLLVLFLLFVIVWQLRGVKSALICTVTMLTLGFVGVWNDAMKTLALVIASVVVCSAIGFPLGVIAARSNPFERLSRPVLDTMQTLPAFVYLVPVVLLVGIGDLPGVIVTAVFALPPIIRLTSLGIRGVPVPIIEAFVHDDHFAVFDHIFHVSLIKRMRFDGGLHVMLQRPVFGVGDVAIPSSFSTFSQPTSVTVQLRCFSSTTKSPVMIFGSPGCVSISSPFSSLGMMRFTL